MDIIRVVLAVGCIALTLVTIRCMIVYSIRQHAIDLIYGKVSPLEWKTIQYDFGDETAQVYALSKWTFPQFYPDIKEKE